MELPAPLMTLTEVNFNPNDGVSATHDVLYPSTNAVFPDYLIESHAVTDNGEVNQIESRWFILEGIRLRNGMYHLVLRRDVVADFQDYIVNAPCFIEKATLQPEDNFIFNSENMKFNQIKTSETLLSDRTKTPWLCLYIDKKWNAQDSTFPKTGTLQIESQHADYSVSSGDYTNWEYYFTSQNPFKLVKNYGPAIAASSEASLVGIADFYQGYINSETGSVNSTYYYGSESVRPLRWAKGVQEMTSEYGNYIRQLIRDHQDILATIKTKFYNSYINVDHYYDTTSSEWANIQEANGKILLANGKYYRISIVASQSGRDINKYGAIPLNTDLSEALKSLISYKPSGYAIKQLTGDPGATSFWNWFDYQEYITVLTEMPEGSTSSVIYSYDMSNITDSTMDAPWDMICLPYGDDVYLGQTQRLNNRLIVEAFATAIRGTSMCYDAQILPYCPISGVEATVTIENNGVHIPAPSEGTGISITQTKSSIVSSVSYVYMAHTSKISGTLSYSIEVQDYKIESQTDMYRLSSPNYSSSFDFNAAKNGGVVAFEYACTFMPINPFIYVHPTFGRLYGSNGIPGARGLICAGDFGLPMWTDQWQQYQVNNKNFQQSFDRQIQNMEFNNNMARIEELVGIGVGTIGGAVSGATTGAVMSGMNPAGAIAGAVVGAGTSLAGGVADFVINEAKRAEALDYAKDQFGYTLGNIQALPNTISRTTSFTNINKYFPVLEYYTCSEEEKQALRSKIQYNGMTVMRIGTIGEFIRNERTYIKGKIIRIENFPEDTHVLNAIAEEIYKGVFI